jgi:hypothetical protein
MKLEKGMTNMFKKSVLAIALAGISSGVMAADLNGSASEFSKEFLKTVVVNASGASAGQITDAGDNTTAQVSFTYEMGANYAINDVITLTVSDDSIVGSTFPTEVVQYLVPATPIDDEKVTLSRISQEVVDGKTTVVYRVSNLGSAVVNTTGLEFTFDNLVILPRKITKDVTVGYTAKTVAGLTLDNTSSTTAEKNAVLVEVVTQFEELDVVANLDATVDVNDNRFSFLANPSAEFAVEGDTPAVLPVTVTAVTYTINGDFSWLLDEDGAVDTDIADVTSNVGTTVEVEADKVILTRADATPPTLVIAPDAASETIIPDQKFTVSAELEYAAGAANAEGTVSFSAVNAGQWSLNGASVHIPYMPYGDNITQVINLNNAGSQEGDITVEGFDRAGNKFGPVFVGSAVKNSQVSLAQGIKDALTTAGISANERVSLKLVVNVPATDVTVYSAYNTNGNGARLVVNDSNGK